MLGMRLYRFRSVVREVAENGEMRAAVSKLQQDFGPGVYGRRVSCIVVEGEEMSYAIVAEVKGVV